MNTIESRGYLSQQDLVTNYPNCLVRDGWTTLYRRAADESALFESSSALASPDRVSELMRDCQWDLQPDDGMPEFSWENGATKPTYHRYGNNEGMRPIIMLRKFSGSHPEYLELAEDFRLYHDLEEEEDPVEEHQSAFFKTGDKGERIEVARVTQDTVRVRTSFLHEFLRATNQCLALYVDSKRYADVPIDAIPESDRDKSLSDGTVTWEVHIGEHWEPHLHGTYSRFLGKAIVR